MDVTSFRFSTALTPILLAAALAACGGTKAQEASAPGVPTNEARSSAEAETAQAATERAAKTEPAKPAQVAREIPTECVDAKAAVCTPPPAFAKNVCKKASPTIALAMFQKKMPWTRAYMRVNTKAWYAKARRTHPKELKFGEELVVLEHRSGGSGGIQVSGSGSYDVYRWDGTCASVMADEVTLRRPTFPKTAAIRWRKLKDGTRDVLEKNRKIKFRLDLSRKRCSKDVAAKRCEKARDLLSAMIADHVRRGGDVPDPERFAW